MTKTPFEIILNRVKDSTEFGVALRSALSDLHEGKNFDKLLEILRSDNKYAVADGLYLLSESGLIPMEVLNEALDHTKHPSWEARFYLADAALSCVNHLDNRLIAKTISMAADENADVRNKISEIISRIDIDRLKDSAAELGGEQGADHLRALAIFETPVSYKELLATVSQCTGIARTYAVAALLRRARQTPGGPDIPISEIGPEFDYLRWRIDQIGRYDR